MNAKLFSYFFGKIIPLLTWSSTLNSSTGFSLNRSVTSQISRSFVQEEIFRRLRSPEALVEQETASLEASGKRKKLNPRRNTGIRFRNFLEKKFNVEHKTKPKCNLLIFYLFISETNKKKN